MKGVSLALQGVYLTLFQVQERGKLKRILREEWIKDSPDPVPALAEELQVSENFMRKRLELEKVKIED